MPYFDSLEVFDGGNNQLVAVIPSFNLVVSIIPALLGLRNSMQPVPVVDPQFYPFSTCL